MAGISSKFLASLCVFPHRNDWHVIRFSWCCRWASIKKGDNMKGYRKKIFGLVRNILQKDLQHGNKVFLEYAYDKLNLYGNKRILEMSGKYPKESRRIEDFVYENIIGIILEECMEKQNVELFSEIMEYYKTRYPHIEKEFEKCGNSQKKYDDFISRELCSVDTDIVEINFLFLYYSVCVKTDQKDRMELLSGDEICWTVLEQASLYGFSWNGSGDYVHSVGKILGTKNLYEEKIYIRYIEKQRKILADYLKVPADGIENYIIQHSVVTHFMDEEGGNTHFIKRKDIADTVQGMQFLWVENSIRQVFEKYNLSLPSISLKKERVYQNIIKWELEHLCVCLIWSKYESYKIQGKKLELNMIISQASIENPQAVYMQLVLLFYADLLADTLREALELHCKDFSIGSQGEGHACQKLLLKINRLEGELATCKEQLKENGETNFKQKQKQYQTGLKAAREHKMQVISLEKKLEEQQKLNKVLKQKLSDQEQYIKLLIMPEEKVKSGSEVPDISKFRNKKIAFIGGRPEIIRRMKKEFYNAVFITNETSDIPQKIDAMVMFPDFMGHPLFNKYIALNREKKIQLVYCNSANTDLILQKLGQEFSKVNS